eukprot:9049972-Pyramimonas_sp.AAC.1
MASFRDRVKPYEGTSIEMMENPTSTVHFRKSDIAFADDSVGELATSHPAQRDIVVDPLFKVKCRVSSRVKRAVH